MVSACVHMWVGHRGSYRRHVDAIGDLAIEHYHELANKVTPSLGVQGWRVFNGLVENNWLFRCACRILLCV